MKTGRDWAGDVSDVGKHSSAYALCDFADAFEVDDARVGRSAADEQFRFVLFSNALQFVVIDLLRLAGDAVVGNLVTDAGKVHRMTVCEMAAVRKVHTQNLIAILNRGEIDRHVCLGAAVRLNVGVIGAKDLFRAIDCRLFDDVGPLAAAVVTLLRITFRVLVRED